MADRNLDLALRIRADLGQAIQSMKRLEGGIEGAGRKSGRAAARLRALGVAAEAARRRVGGLQSALLAFGAVRAIQATIRATVRQEQAIAQVEARIRATGGAAGLTSREIQDMASALQDVTTRGGLNDFRPTARAEPAPFRLSLPRCRGDPRVLRGPRSMRTRWASFWSWRSSSTSRQPPGSTCATCISSSISAATMRTSPATRPSSKRPTTPRTTRTSRSSAAGAWVGASEDGAGKAEMDEHGRTAHENLRARGRWKVGRANRKTAQRRVFGQIPARAARLGAPPLPVCP